ncbi:hypothetical protein QIH97_gp17 [Enterobacter phage KNP3]|nr:hypothetical protein QIH97_gp17 [Enterobacter phage KNP3]
MVALGSGFRVYFMRLTDRDT